MPCVKQKGEWVRILLKRNETEKWEEQLLYNEEPHMNPLNTKRRLLYLKIQFVPRSKHFSSRL